MKDYCLTCNMWLGMCRNSDLLNLLLNEQGKFNTVTEENLGRIVTIMHILCVCLFESLKMHLC